MTSIEINPERVASLISSLVFYLVDRSFISPTNLVRLMSLY